MLTFKIDGVEYKNFITLGGIKWSRNDLDDSTTGRTLDGVMHRNRIAYKIKLEVSLKRLTQEQLTQLNNALLPTFINVTYLDPISGVVTKTFYGSTISAAIAYEINGIVTWDNGTFNVMEK